MFVHYLYWHYVAAPWWLLKTIYYLELALLKYFSVSFMLRTLFSHWHRDTLRYQAGSLSGYFKTFLLNQISRLIGFIIRSTVLSAWLIAQMVLVLVSALSFLFFISWPILTLLGLAWGLALFLV